MASGSRKRALVGILGRHAWKGLTNRRPVTKIPCLEFFDGDAINDLDGASGHTGARGEAGHRCCLIQLCLETHAIVLVAVDQYQDQPVRLTDMPIGPQPLWQLTKQIVTAAMRVYLPGNIMPNPKRRHSTRRTALRRAHDFLTAVGFLSALTATRKASPSCLRQVRSLQGPRCAGCKRSQVAYNSNAYRHRAGRGWF